MSPLQEVLFTIGHSTHPSRSFIELLRQHEITAIGDVRSSPYSRFNPQFNRETLKRDLRAARIAYLFLGDELGARRSESECYDAQGKVLYDVAARTPLFLAGIERLRQGMQDYRLALMCAERDPIQCHRTLLVCRALRVEAFDIVHILADGSLEPHAALERRLLRKMKLPTKNLFADSEEMIRRAYDA